MAVTATHAGPFAGLWDYDWKSVSSQRRHFAVLSHADRVFSFIWVLGVEDENLQLIPMTKFCERPCDAKAFFSDYDLAYRSVQAKLSNGSVDKSFFVDL
jgi:hypothetical protein